MQIFDNKIGLVFAGGGGKGAYQIGVWQALQDAGISKRIGGISGASVGALNAVLFAIGDLNKSIELWKGVTPSIILKPQDKCSCEKVIEHLPYIKNNCAEGWFSRDGLLEMMKNSILSEDIEKIKIPCFVSCSKLKRIHSIYSISKLLSEREIFGKALSLVMLPLLKLECTAEYFNITRYEINIIYKMLLASSAIPLIFDEVDIFRNKYLDGGLEDNVPVLPLYNIGFRKFLVVSLQSEASDRQNNFKNTEFYEISCGGRPIPNLASTFDFTPESIEKRMKQGYYDAMNQIDKIISFFDEA